MHGVVSWPEDIPELIAIMGREGNVFKPLHRPLCKMHRNPGKPTAKYSQKCSFPRIPCHKNHFFPHPPFARIPAMHATRVSPPPSRSTNHGNEKTLVLAPLYVIVRLPPPPATLNPEAMGLPREICTTMS